jgi:hypothetical protein
MTEEQLWFEPTTLLSRCSLNEGLLWVWDDRVPLDNVWREKNAFDTLRNEECEYLEIPPVPAFIGRGARYVTEQRLRAKHWATDDQREYYVKEGMEEAEAIRKWIPIVTQAMDWPATELFLKLRRGEIEAQGKLLPDGAEIIDFLEKHESWGGPSKFDDLVDSPIPSDLWTNRGIDWFSNALIANNGFYCDVSMPVEILMNHFPGHRTAVDGAEFVGQCLLVKEPENANAPSSATRGRPAVFAWNAFHVEVADLIKRDQLPQKKEAGIQEMIGWFERTQKQTPSRSAVSEKLTPYYRRFFLT